MSRFFNESQEAARQKNSEDAKAALRDRITTLRETVLKDVIEDNNLEKVRLESARTTGPAHPVENLENGNSGAVAAPIQICTKIRLPRDQSKTLLMREYNLSLQQSAEAYRTLRTKLIKHQMQTGLHSLVISSPGPAEGKTLTSFNLGVCFAKIQNGPVLLVDADLRTRGMSRWFGDRSLPGLAQILDSGGSYESAIFQTDIPELYVLPAGESSVPPPELFARRAFKEFMSWSCKTFKLILLDAPPVLHLADFELIEAACDGVALVVRLGKTNRNSLASTCAQVDPAKLVGVILNDSHEHTENSYYRYLETGGGKGAPGPEPLKAFG